MYKLFAKVISRRQLTVDGSLLLYRLIINDSIHSGTQLPYIKWARENGYAVVVANTNINTVEPAEGSRKKKDAIKIRVSSKSFDTSGEGEQWPSGA